MQVKEETRISLTFLRFFSILPLCFMAEEETEPEFPGYCWVAALRRASKPCLL